MLKIAIHGDEFFYVNLSQYIEKLTDRKYDCDNNIINLSIYSNIKDIANRMFPDTPYEFFHHFECKEQSTIDKIIPKLNKKFGEFIEEIKKFGKSYDKNIWTNHILRKIKDAERDYFDALQYYKKDIEKGEIDLLEPIIIVIDLMTMDEFNVFKDEGFKFIKVISKRTVNTSLKTDLNNLSDSEFNYIVKEELNFEIDNQTERIVKDLLNKGLICLC